MRDFPDYIEKNYQNAKNLCCDSKINRDTLVKIYYTSRNDTKSLHLVKIFTLDQIKNGNFFQKMKTCSKQSPNNFVFIKKIKFIEK